jgi:saccharopine dehydrogenase-like NADP-dependent oxidoreductase
MSREPAYRILILGGYGHFGNRIAHALAAGADRHILIAGRDGGRAQKAAATLRDEGTTATIEGIALDVAGAGLAEEIRRQRANLVIHAAGPFQGQAYDVARASVDAGAHYVDLADGREFVAGIAALDASARERDVLVVSGASTLPALSSAVIDSYRDRFMSIAEISVGIVPGNRMPRGLSTVAAVLSYCGKPFTRWQNGEWQQVYGWQDLHRRHYPRLGRRWLSSCDVPDLALFPDRYAVKDTVVFHAGLELASMQWSLWLMSWLARVGLVSNWMPAAGWLKAAGDKLIGLGSDTGGMHVEIAGVDANGKVRRVLWTLTASKGHGPLIPCIPAIMLAQKLASGKIAARGARPCMDLMTLEDFAEGVKGMEISWEAAD